MPDPPRRAATGRRAPRLALVVIVLAAAGGAWLADTALWCPLPLSGAAPRDGFTRLAGVVHVHTIHSDGGGGPGEVIAAAQAAGLDFVFLTDHNNLDAKPHEGYHGRLLVGVGSEISTTSGHVLALGIDDPAFRFWGDLDATLDDVRALGGAAFAAHPDSPRPDLRWSAWAAPGPWGIEAYNGDSQWRSAGLLRLLRTAARYPVQADRALLDSLTSPHETLRRWDELLRTRDVPMLAGSDAHSRIAFRRERGDGSPSRDGPRPRGRGLRFPSYVALFRLARNHVLLDAPPSGDATRDLRRIVDALARGRSYAALDALAPGGAFAFEGTAGERRFGMGDTTPLLPGLRLRAGGRVPARAEAVLLHDGREVARGRGAVEHGVTAPGVYRAEVRVAGWPVPWALSNPIYVFDGGDAERRRRAAAWPHEAAAPPVRRVLDDFEGRTIFQVEADPSSSVAQPLVAATASEAAAPVGPSGTGLGRVAFHLGRPRPGGPPHPWCALVSRTPRDFAGAQGLALTLKADGVYRFSIQVRDVNPQGSDEGLETWLTSVRTSTAWRRVAVPFARLRSLDPRSDGRLDLRQVRVLGLVIDDLTLKPGTRGTLFIDDLALY